MARERFIATAMKLSIPQIKLIEKIGCAVLQKNGVEVSKYLFGACKKTDLELINAMASLTGRYIEDSSLSKISDFHSLCRFASSTINFPSAPGVPLIELRLKEKIPDNVNLVNYEKKRWSTLEKREFVRKQLGE